MARIAFAWELGGGLGHAMACNALARELRARGHRIAFIFRELAPLAYIAECAAHDVFQAPVSLAEGAGKGMPSSIAEILLGCGYDRARHVSGLLAGWISLFERWKPDVVVSDFSPTALAAARLLGLRHVSQGNGFSIPPRLTPIPAFRFDEPMAPGHLEQAEANALASLNSALARLGAPTLGSLAQLFESDEDFLTTFPELDSYGTRAASGYWGPGFDVDSGDTVAWPRGEGPRIAIYLRQFRQLDALVDAVAASTNRVVAFFQGVEPARTARLAGPSRLLSPRPVRLAPLLAECDLFVSHGGSACIGTLLAGVPQLVFPGQYEQYITGRRIEQLGAGTWVGSEDTAETLAVGLSRVLGDPSYATVARAYARRYSGYTPREQARRIVKRIEQILAAPSRWARSVPARTDAILAPTSPGPKAP
jgi:UDP:flavonoid glycosyltransferase YjiC (YdhE family)